MTQVNPGPQQSGPSLRPEFGSASTLDQLVPFLGPQVVRQAFPGSEPSQPISMAVIFDPEDPIVATPGGLLLFTGRPDEAFGSDLLTRLAEAGFSGIAVKDRPGALEATPAHPPIGVLLIDEDVSWRQLFALVSAAAQQRSTEHDPEHSAQSLFSIANSLAAALGGATAIEDRERNVLAYSTVFGHTVDSLRRDGILARQVPDLPKHNTQYRELYAATGPIDFPFDPSDGELPRTAIALRAGPEILGSIWVILENDAPAQRTESVLRDAATLAAIQLLRHRSAQDIETHLREEWLRSALSGEASDSWHDSRFGVRPQGSVALLAFRTEDAGQDHAPHSSELKLAAVSVARLHGLEASATVVRNRCYLLVTGVEGKAAAQRTAENVGRALTKRFECRLSIAVGTFAWQEAALDHVRVELDDALSALDQHREICRVLFIEDIRSELLLLALSRHLQDYQRLATPELAEIQATDSETGSEHERTLLAFLSALGDIPAAARELRVHPNTLRYRLKRIAATFHMDLSDPDTALAVWFQLWTRNRADRASRP